MPRPPARTRRSSCPISIALELLGDPWSLLIVRDLMFKGRHTFGALAGGGEGIATNILAARLARLGQVGLLARRRDPSDGRRWVYSLTRKGLDLAPVLLELVLWSAKHEDTGAPEAELREMRHHRRRFLARVARQDGPLKRQSATAVRKRGG